MAIESSLGGRYLVNRSELPQLLKSIGEMAIEVHYNGNWNNTIYFNNTDHELYFGQTVRARRYSTPAPDANLQIAQKDKWALEQKSVLYSKNEVLKHIQSDNYVISQINDLLRFERKLDGVKLSEALRPFIAVSSLRSSFLAKSDARFKITVDDQTKYYAFMNNYVARQIGREDFARVELRLSEAVVSSGRVLEQFQELMHSVCAVPVISKKDAGYNMLGTNLKLKYGWQPGQTDTEIESKLSLSVSHQNLFNIILNDFATDGVKGFAPLEKFPCMLEGGKIITYMITKDNRYVRLNSKGDQHFTTTKEGKEIMNDPYGLGCILKRNEIETEVSSSIPKVNGKEIVLYKKFKQFWVYGKESGNHYHLSMDGCYPINGNQSSLNQIEVESTMLRPSKEQVSVATKEIADITKQLIDMHDKLKPTTLTKREWISELIRSE